MIRPRMIGAARRLLLARFIHAKAKRWVKRIVAHVVEAHDGFSRGANFGWLQFLAQLTDDELRVVMDRARELASDLISEAPTAKAKREARELSRRN